MTEWPNRPMTDRSLRVAMTGTVHDDDPTIIADMQQKIDRQAERIKELEEALDRIAQWTQAYPLSVFPEPDWKRARALLEAGGMTLDSVSAGAMRRVVDGIARIVAEVRPQ